MRPNAAQKIKEQLANLHADLRVLDRAHDVQGKIQKSTSGDLSLHDQATEHVIGNVRCAPGCFSF